MPVKCVREYFIKLISNCYDILNSSRLFNYTYIWCYQSSMQLSHSGGFISKNCKTSLKKLKSSMACRIFWKSKTTLWVWFFPESSRVRISPSFPTIAAYPVDLPNAGVALSNLTIFQMRCCQHREMFKIGKKYWKHEIYVKMYEYVSKLEAPNSYGMEVLTWKCTVDYQQNNYQVHSITNVVSGPPLLWCHALNSKSVAMGRFCFHRKTHVLPKWCLLDASWLIIHPVA